MMWPWHSHMCSTLKHEPLQNQGHIEILQCWHLGWCTVWDSVWLWTDIHWWDKEGIGYQIEGTSGSHQKRRDWEVSLCQACLVPTPPTPLGEYKDPGSSGQQHHPADEVVPCTSPSKTQERWWTGTKASARIVWWKCLIEQSTRQTAQQQQNSVEGRRPRWVNCTDLISRLPSVHYFQFVCCNSVHDPTCRLIIDSRMISAVHSKSKNRLGEVKSSWASASTALPAVWCCSRGSICIKMWTEVDQMSNACQCSWRFLLTHPILGLKRTRLLSSCWPLH